ncbi:MAG: LUD domain-containing protein, partial [Deltaproteobacteria bacterium]|nr:LUD domain-containing protein [Deltaproteobacteria bacterium]
MDNPIENFWQIRLTEVKTALETNNFEVFLAEKKEGVHRIVLEDIIPQLKPKTISWGGSMTFTGSGLYKKLKDRSDIEVWDTFADKISDNEKNQRRRQALHADLFITGTNAITEAGQLVNLD